MIVHRAKGVKETNRLNTFSMKELTQMIQKFKSYFIIIPV